MPGSSSNHSEMGVTGHVGGSVGNGGAGGGAVAGGVTGFSRVGVGSTMGVASAAGWAGGVGAIRAARATKGEGPGEGGTGVEDEAPTPMVADPW